MGTYLGIYFKDNDSQKVITEFRKVFKKGHWRTEKTQWDDNNFYENIPFKHETSFGVTVEMNWTLIVTPNYWMSPLDDSPFLSINDILNVSKKLNCDSIVFSYETVSSYTYWCYIEKGTIRRIHSDILSDEDDGSKANEGVPFDFEYEIKSHDKYWDELPDEVKSDVLFLDWAFEYCKKMGLTMEKGYAHPDVVWHVGENDDE